MLLDTFHTSLRGLALEAVNEGVGGQLQKIEGDLKSLKTIEGDLKTIEAELRSLKQSMRKMEKNNIQFLNTHLKDNDMVKWISPAPTMDWAKEATRFSIYVLFNDEQISEILTHYELPLAVDAVGRRSSLLRFLGFIFVVKSA